MSVQHLTSLHKRVMVDPSLDPTKSPTPVIVRVDGAGAFANGFAIATGGGGTTIKGLEMTVSFAAGEWMHMEHSYKFDVEELVEMGLQSGFRLERTWMDERQRFSSNLFRASEVS